jgi:hypothetical protein
LETVNSTRISNLAFWARLIVHPMALVGAVRFVSNVPGGPDRAGEIAGESLDADAERLRIRAVTNAGSGCLFGNNLQDGRRAELDK